MTTNIRDIDADLDDADLDDADDYDTSEPLWLAVSGGIASWLAWTCGVILFASLLMKAAL